MPNAYTVSMNKVDDVGFVGLSSTDLEHRNHKIVLLTEYKFPRRGKLMATIHNKIPYGESLLCIGLYNKEWVGYGGKYQYEFKIEVDGVSILNDSSNGKVMDKSKGLKFFRVFRVVTDSKGYITTDDSNTKNDSLFISNQYISLLSERINK